MKKLIALLLTAVMVLGCAAALAEETTIASADGSFSLSFQLPDGAEMVSGSWINDSTYMANLKTSDGLYLYLSVSAPEANAEEDADIASVTYNEENGYTDEVIKASMEFIAAQDADAEDYETGVLTTAYGTKLGVIRFSGEAPSAYIMTVWHDYEVGLTLACVDETGAYQPITDEALQKVVDFVSELWMTEKTAE